MNELSDDAAILLTDESFLFLGLNSEEPGIELWKYDAVSPVYTQIHYPGQASFLVYPNPSSTGIFEFQLPQSGGTAILSITDISGRKIYESQVEKGTNTINVSAFSKGLYILEITGNTERLVTRIIYE